MNIIFDFGGVLMDWDPRHLYKQVFDQEEKMEWFLREVCNNDWNTQMDSGKPFAEAIKEKTVEYPQYKSEIEIYFDRWIEMIRGQIDGSVDILYQLKDKEFKLYGLTNWSDETFPLVRHTYAFFDELEGIVVSGEEGLAKPDPAIYQLMMKRFKLKAEECLFIDDNIDNIESANDFGMKTIHFRSPEQLRFSLEKAGIQL